MNHPKFDLEFYPPFEGFPRRGVTFLRQLKRNNRKEWFSKHKDNYETYVKLPFQSLIASLQTPFREFAPEFDVNPKRSMFRIYRDVRFSKDKSPYKTHVAAHFVVRGKPKGTEGSGYYLHIEPGEVFVGAGIYMPLGEQVKKIRAGIANRDSEFLRLVRDPRLRRMFGELEGDQLRRVPQGYGADHPMADWLRYKQFFVGISWPVSRCYSPRFTREIARAFATATPLVRFLNNAIS
ncbi:MAG: DUF2461 domain-containing protein [Ignavibacteriales bacterium]|nr:DUF2461 domain-containing protein [Ignavibacteriales bacterium]